MNAPAAISNEELRRTLRERPAGCPDWQRMPHWALVDAATDKSYECPGDDPADRVNTDGFCAACAAVHCETCGVRLAVSQNVDEHLQPV